MHSILLLLLMLVVALIPTEAADCNWKITGQYDGSYNGELYITPTQNMNGWTVNLTFDKPFASLEAYTAQYSNSAGLQSTTLTPMSWNVAINAGQTLTIQFLVRYTNNNNPSVASATLNGQAFCGVAPSAPVATTVSPIVVVNSPTCNWKITGQYDGSYNGEFYVTPTQNINGWTINLAFDKPFTSLEVYTAQYTNNGDSQSATLTPMSWNTAVSAGQTLTIQFLVRYSNNNKPSVASATLNGQAACGASTVAGTTVAATTVTTTPAATTTTTAATTTSTTKVTTTAAATTKAATTTVATTKAATTTVTTTTKSATTTVTTKSTSNTVTTTKAATTTSAATTTATTTVAFTTTAAATTAATTATATTTATTTAANMACNWKITGQYDGSYLAEFYIVPTQNLNGWTVNLGFDRAFDWFESYTAQYSNNNGYQSTTLTPMSWNVVVNAGQTLTLQFLVKYSNNNKPNVAGATLNGQSVCGGGASATTAATTTVASGTTASSSSGSSTTASSGAYDYKDALAKSLLFYEAQRSGKLPSTNRIPWRQDSALQDLAIGGYYDAGDNVKFGFPMAGMTTQLAWGAITFKAGYVAANQLTYITDCLKWATDYFIKAHTSANELYVQFGNGGADHALWFRPEDNNPSNRPAYKVDSGHPGSDVAGETAAALAAAAIFYTSIGQPTWAAECLQHARDLFNFADTYRGKYSDSIPDAASFYNSWSGYNDELGWASAWLYYATGEASYLSKSESFFDPSTPTEFSWDNKNAGHRILLYKLTNKDVYKTSINSLVDQILNRSPYTPKGLVYINSWGSLRHAGNLAHACLQIAQLGLNTDTCTAFAKKQIQYALGSTGRSYLVGYGNNYPQQPHHRAASCPDIPQSCGFNYLNSNAPNPHVIVGALVGGPDANDNYNDVRSNYQQGEVATDYNAGFQSALAALVTMG